MAYFFLTIFYLIGILAITWEFMGITSPIKMHKAFKEMRKIMKSEGGFDSLPSNYKTVSFLMIGYFIWVLVGLFTNNWLIFLALLVLSVIPKRWVVQRWIDSVITLALLLFAIINTFHLHINLNTLFL